MQHLNCRMTTAKNKSISVMHRKWRIWCVSMKELAIYCRRSVLETRSWKLKLHQRMVGRRQYLIKPGFTTVGSNFVSLSVLYSLQANPHISVMLIWFTFNNRFCTNNCPKIVKHFHSDNDASKLDILGHCGTIRKTFSQVWSICRLFS